MKLDCQRNYHNVFVKKFCEPSIQALLLGAAERGARHGAAAAAGVPGVPGHGHGGGVQPAARVRLLHQRGHVPAAAAAGGAPGRRGGARVHAAGDRHHQVSQPQYLVYLVDAKLCA